VIADLKLAVAAAWLLGLEARPILDALPSLTLGPTRMESWRTPSGVTVIDDSHSADPVSVQAALAALPDSGTRVFVFGGMRGLGDRCDAEHALVGRLAAEQGVEHLIVLDRSADPCADNFASHSARGTVHRVAAEELGRVARGLAGPGDTILVKGPREAHLSEAAREIFESMTAKRLRVDLGALLHNLGCFRRALGPEVEILAVLKAWAYGTELARVASWLQAHGIDRIGVSTADEGALARRAGIHLPILVLLPDAREADKIVRYGLTPAIYSHALAVALGAAAERADEVLDVHLKVDTGMGRLGVRPDDASTAAALIAAHDNLRLTGVMTHLSCADDPNADPYSTAQLSQFSTVTTALEEAGHTGLLRHAAASAAALRFEDSRLDMVRLGLGLYGIHGSEAVRRALPDLQLAVALVSRLADVKRFRRGDRIGYGGTYIVEAPSQVIGIVEMGYADGVPWSLSGCGEVMLGGVRVPILGRVSMDSLAVDLSACPDASPGDDVLLFGVHAGSVLRPEEVAARAGTIPWELLVRVDTRRVARVFVGP